MSSNIKCIHLAGSHLRWEEPATLPPAAHRRAELSPCTHRAWHFLQLPKIQKKHMGTLQQQLQTAAHAQRSQDVLDERAEHEPLSAQLPCSTRIIRLCKHDLWGGGRPTDPGHCGWEGQRWSVLLQPKCLTACSSHTRSHPALPPVAGTSPRRRRGLAPSALPFRNSTHAASVLPKLVEKLDDSSVACTVLDLPQHTPLCSITWGFGLQHADSGRTCCIPHAQPLLLCLRQRRAQHVALLGNRTGAHCNRRNHQRPSRAAGSPHAKQCNTSGITLLFSTQLLHIFFCRTQSSEEGKPCCLLLPTP